MKHFELTTNVRLEDKEAREDEEVEKEEEEEEQKIAEEQRIKNCLGKRRRMHTESEPDVESEVEVSEQPNNTKRIVFKRQRRLAPVAHMHGEYRA